MSKQNAKELLPILRFPEFQEGGEWRPLKLSELSDRITEKVGEKQLTTVSITAGKGFVSQAEKFSRDISGKQYKNYIRLRRGEFSYNKGNSKKYAQGCVYKLKEFEEVAAPNAFLSFKFKDLFVADFYQGYFESNAHGKQLLRYITSGARSDGLLNIKPDDFFSIILPTPEQKREQQKIADCLSSVDELITAHTQKLEALKAHKKGLMQQLFPAEGESVPKLRFQEFRGKWIKSTINGVASVSSGGTPSRSQPEYWDGDIPWVTTTLIDFNTIYSANEYITEAGLNNSSAKIYKKNTILMAMYGQGKTRGQVAKLGGEAAINQACAAITLKKTVLTEFVFQNLASRYEEIREIREISNDGGQKNLSSTLIKDIPFSYPDVKSGEQQKIADCLSSIDSVVESQAQKVELLKAHKVGLMQQLFPSVEGVSRAI